MCWTWKSWQSWIFKFWWPFCVMLCRNRIILERAIRSENGKYGRVNKSLKMDKIKKWKKILTALKKNHEAFTPVTFFLTNILFRKSNCSQVHEFIPLCQYCGRGTVFVIRGTTLIFGSAQKEPFPAIFEFISIQCWNNADHRWYFSRSLKQCRAISTEIYEISETAVICRET